MLVDSIFITSNVSQMRVSFNLLLFMLFSFSVKGQITNVLGSLSGKIRDEVSNEVVDYAAVNLITENNSLLVKSAMSDSDGSFQFEDVPFGTYRIKISFIGYESRIIENVVVNKENVIRNLGTIKLKQATNSLDEVTITDSKLPIEFNGDTITFNVSQSLMAAGSTASDLLKNVPMVSVDIDGKPSIAGKVNTRIFIDSKPSDYTSATITDLLNVLPSDAIEKIEVITNPDVKYSADGDGIINIVLKKGYKIGLNGAISVTASALGNYNANLYTAYRNETLSLSSSYGFRDNRVIASMTSLRDNYNASGTPSSYMNQFSDSENSNNGHNARISADWDINAKQNLRVSANLNIAGTSGYSHLDDYRLDFSAIEQELRIQDNENASSSVNGIFNADYNYKINKKNETLTAGLTYYKNSSLRDRELSRIYHNPDGTTSNAFLQHNENEISNRRFEFNIDYKKPLTKLSTLSVGVQTTLNKNSDDQLVNGFDFDTQQDSLSPGLTNVFTYSEKIYSVYGSYNLRTKSKWSFRAGLRTEFTDVNFLDETIENIGPKPYANIFPNLSINKLFNKKYNLGLSYSKRIARPRENALNPLIDDSNQSNISFGNPALQPSYTNQFQLSLGTHGTTWSLTPRISYAVTGKIIERFRISPDSVTYKNLGTNTTLTTNLFGNYRPTKKITVAGGFSISRVSYESLSALQPNRTGYSYLGNGTLMGQFPYKISAEGQINYSNNTISQGRTKSSTALAFGLRKTFLANKMLIRVLVNDPFSNRNTAEYIEGITTTGSTYIQDKKRQTSTTNYSLTLSYRFTKVGRNSLNKQKADKQENGILSSD